MGKWNSRPLHDDNRICYIVNDFRWRDVTGQTPQRNGPSLCWFRNRDPHSVSVPSEPRTQPPPPPAPTHLTSLPNLVVIQKPTLTSLRPFWSMNLDPPTPNSLRLFWSKDPDPSPYISPYYRLTPSLYLIYTEIQTYHSPVRTYPHIDPLVRLPPSNWSIQTSVIVQKAPFVSYEKRIKSHLPSFAMCFQTTCIPLLFGETVVHVYTYVYLCSSVVLWFLSRLKYCFLWGLATWFLIYVNVYGFVHGLHNTGI